MSTEKKKTVIYNGQEVEVFDCTPTWLGLLPMLLEIVRQGKADTPLLDEFKKMAKAADKWNAYNKALDIEIENGLKKLR